MPDDRPALTDVEQIALMQKQIDDLQSTMLARVSRSPTGTIDQTILATAPPDTLFLQGQTVNRADYPTLWQWASDNGRVGVAGLFGAGNGTTTFVLPDFRNRVLVAAGTLAPGATVGSDTVALAVGNLPAHDHNVAATLTTSSDSHSHTSSHSTFHTHTFNTGSGGSHGQHPPFQIPVAAGSGANDVWAGGGVSTGSHTHGGTTAGDGSYTHNVSSDAHTHTVATTESTIGSGTAIDVRQSSIAINYLIWT